MNRLLNTYNNLKYKYKLLFLFLIMSLLPIIVATVLSLLAIYNFTINKSVDWRKIVDERIE
jgi:hypothetical protein